MLATTIAYKFFLRDGEEMRGASLSTWSGPEDSQPRTGASDIECDLSSVDTILLTEDRSVKIYWARGLFDVKGGPAVLMEEPRDVALITNCEGGVWVVRSEPTVDGRIGLSVANEAGKALFIGTGDLIELRDPDDDPYQLIAVFEHVYQWRQSSPKACAHCHGAIRKGGRPDGGT